MALILTVDDDPDALGTISRVLQHAGHDVVTVSQGHNALQFLAHTQPDLIILDIIMPGMTGIDVCQRIRANPFYARIPIIFLTAKSRPEDIKAGLEAGGDDYITKPFQIIELPARVTALLRRAPGGVLDSQSEFLAVGALRLQQRRPVLHIHDEAYEITSIQHRLLYYLMTHADQPQSIEQLLEHVWDYAPGTGDPNLVYAHIKNLRKKIEVQPDAPAVIHSVHGQGYIIYS